MDWADALSIIGLIDTALCALYAILIALRERKRKRQLKELYKKATDDLANDDMDYMYCIGKLKGFNQAYRLFFGKDIDA